MKQKSEVVVQPDKMKRISAATSLSAQALRPDRLKCGDAEAEEKVGGLCRCFFLQDKFRNSCNNRNKRNQKKGSLKASQNRTHNGG